MRKQIMISLPELYLTKLNEYCKNYDTTKSQVIRNALDVVLFPENFGFLNDHCYMEHELTETKR